jgi:hypothetical protein
MSKPDFSNPKSKPPEPEKNDTIFINQKYTFRMRPSNNN